MWYSFNEDEAYPAGCQAGCHVREPRVWPGRKHGQNGTRVLAKGSRAARKQIPNPQQWGPSGSMISLGVRSGPYWGKGGISQAEGREGSVWTSPQSLNLTPKGCSPVQDARQAPQVPLTWTGPWENCRARGSHLCLHIRITWAEFKIPRSRWHPSPFPSGPLGRGPVIRSFQSCPCLIPG